jgi:pimeloyl-ACP methyl ester carboxylesterase
MESRRVIVFAAFAALLIAALPARAENPLSRPILFVHGWCSNADSWKNTLVGDGLATTLHANHRDLYPSSTVWEVFYDANRAAEADRVRIVFDRSDPPRYSTPLQSASFSVAPRFFAISFYDGVTTKSFDAAAVAEISIVNKASELSHVLKAIQKVTGIDDLIVVTHSMGGLVARAYMQNLVTSRACGTAYLCLNSQFRIPCTTATAARSLPCSL